MADSSQSPERSRKRRRGNGTGRVGRRKKACQTCRLRKVKCDFSRPQCALCKTTSSDCQYLEEDEDPITLDKAVELLSGQLDYLSRQIDDIKHVAEQQPRFALQPTPPPPPPAQQLSDSLRQVIHLPTATTDCSFLEQHEVDGEPEPSRIFSHIPPHRTTADAVLVWPIFDQIYPPSHLVEPHLQNDSVDNENDGESFQMQSELAPLEEHQIPFLVDCFLENVHTKNPILDVEALVRRSRECASKGLGWDSYSCLILMACALGRVAKQFGSELDALDPTVPLSSARHIAAPSNDLRQADNFFVLACRRLGALKPSVLSCQCNFFAGVYLMYTLKPMLSWQYFHAASIHYQLFLKMKGRVMDDGTILTTTFDDRSILERQLAQRLYWSCFKSETEFRVELPLPQSEIANFHFPNLFPSPPSPVAKDHNGAAISQHALVLSPHSMSGTSMTTLSPQTHKHDNSFDDVRSHAKSLSYQEESWFYYLTEIALRRIGNRIINTFFSHPSESKEWLNVTRYLNVAVEFEMQITSWWANLPPAMQKYETNSTIRAPRTGTSPGGAEAGFVSQELSWATENRLLEMRHWLYQPFLYWLVHVRPQLPTDLAFRQRTSSLPSPNDIPQDPTHTKHDALWDLIIRAIDCNLTILRSRSIPHRHHGLWYDLRAIMCSSLICLAVVKAGYTALIPGGVETLVGSSDMRRDHPSSNGLMGRCLRQMDIWSHESPDMLRCREVLLTLTRQIIPHSRLGSL